MARLEVFCGREKWVSAGACCHWMRGRGVALRGASTPCIPRLTFTHDPLLTGFARAIAGVAIICFACNICIYVSTPRSRWIDVASSDEISAPMRAACVQCRVRKVRISRITALARFIHVFSVSYMTVLARNTVLGRR